MKLPRNFAVTCQQGVPPSADPSGEGHRAWLDPARRYRPGNGACLDASGGPRIEAGSPPLAVSVSGTAERQPNDLRKQLPGRFYAGKILFP